MHGILVQIVCPLRYGVEPPVWHAECFFSANMQLGYLMPPMGENLFLASYRFDRPLAAVYRATLPYIAVLVVAALVITYFPPLTLWLLPPPGGK